MLRDLVVASATCTWCCMGVQACMHACVCACMRACMHGERARAASTLCIHPCCCLSCCCFSCCCCSCCCPLSVEDVRVRPPHALHGTHAPRGSCIFLMPASIPPPCMAGMGGGPGNGPCCPCPPIMPGRMPPPCMPMPPCMPIGPIGPCPMPCMPIGRLNPMPVRGVRGARLGSSSRQ